MKLGISVSNNSDTPIYQQIYDQIVAAIIRRDIIGNEMLPSIRTLSSELNVSIITIKRTFEELERSGFIISAQGRGCFVLPLSDEEMQEKRFTQASIFMKKNLPYYKSLGLSCNEIKSLVDSLFIE